MKDMTLPLLGTLIVGTLVGITAASCDETEAAPVAPITIDYDLDDRRGKLPSGHATVRPPTAAPRPPVPRRTAQAPKPAPVHKAPARTGGRR